MAVDKCKDDAWGWRCASAKSYFGALKSAWTAADPAEFWLAKYRERSTLDAPSLMALLHPGFYVRSERYRGSSDDCCIRGPRKIPRKMSPQLMRCESEGFWQYTCDQGWRHASEFVEGMDDRKANEFELDHTFPYSLGGVTVPENRGVLCGLHNRLKSNDIHVCPWENWVMPGCRAPEWAFAAIDAIHAIVR